MQRTKLLTPDIIDTLLTAGSLAPSGGNTQPWKVRVHGDTLSVTVAKERSGGTLDVQLCASLFALGSFVENIEIAARSAGIITTIDFEDNDDPFRVNVNIKCFASAGLHGEGLELARCIPLRMTNRRMSDGTLLSPGTLESLETIIQKKNSLFTLHSVKTNERKEIVATILGRADGIRNCNEQMFREMMQELRWSKEEAEKAKDGIDIYTLELPKNFPAMLQLLKDSPHIKTVFPKSIYTRMALPLLLSSSHLCCISMKNEPTHLSLFEAGRVVQQVWLCATRMEVSLQPWTVLPFLLMRLILQPGTLFSGEESKEILSLGNQLKNVFSIPRDYTAVFLFRLFKGKLPASRAMRLHWTTFTKCY